MSCDPLLWAAGLAVLLVLLLVMLHRTAPAAPAAPAARDGWVPGNDVLYNLPYVYPQRTDGPLPDRCPVYCTTQGCTVQCH